MTFATLLKRSPDKIVLTQALAIAVTSELLGYALLLSLCIGELGLLGPGPTLFLLSSPPSAIGPAAEMLRDVNI